MELQGKLPKKIEEEGEEKKRIHENLSQILNSSNVNACERVCKHIRSCYDLFCDDNNCIWSLHLTHEAIRLALFCFCLCSFISRTVFLKKLLLDHNGISSHCQICTFMDTQTVMKQHNLSSSYIVTCHIGWTHDLCDLFDRFPSGSLYAMVLVCAPRLDHWPKTSSTDRKIYRCETFKRKNHLVIHSWPLHICVYFCTYLMPIFFFRFLLSIGVDRLVGCFCLFLNSSLHKRRILATTISTWWLDHVYFFRSLPLFRCFFFDRLDFLMPWLQAFFARSLSQKLYNRCQCRYLSIRPKNFNTFPMLIYIWYKILWIRWNANLFSSYIWFNTTYTSARARSHTHTHWHACHFLAVIHSMVYTYMCVDKSFGANRTNRMSLSEATQHETNQPSNLCMLVMLIWAGCSRISRWW